MAMYGGTAAGTEIPIENLDYGYIRSCNSDKEVEKILKVLRSGSEGFYPDLIAAAEKRLRQLNPESKLLIKDQKAKTLADLSGEQSAKLVSDIQNWAEKLSTLKAKLRQGGSSSVVEDGDEDDSLPPIRKAATITGKANPPTVKRTANPVTDIPKPSERIKSRDYQGWDKFVAKKMTQDADDDREEDTKESLRVNGNVGSEVKSSTDKPIKVQPQISEKERALPTAQKQLMATREKDKGNEAFRSGDYSEAVAYYSRSIELCPSAAAFNNRAMAGLKLEKYKSAADDCTEVLRIEPHNTKALFRRATAHSSMKSYGKAVSDYEHLLRLEPNNKKAQLELNGLRKKHPHNAKDVGGASGSSKKPAAKKGHRVQIQEVYGSSSDEDDAEVTKSNTSQTTPSPNLTPDPPAPPLNLPPQPPPMPSVVKDLKDKGNTLFQKGQYGDAILMYTRAIGVLLEDDVAELKYSHSILLNNRAACHFKIGDCRQTVNDATESIALQPLNFKALVRRAQAFEAMEKYRQAYNDFHMAMRVDGRSELVLTSCRRLSHTLSDMDGRDWRGKLMPHPEYTAIMSAVQQQYSFTSTAEVTQMVEKTETVAQVDETDAVTSESLITTETVTLVETDTVTLVSDNEKFYEDETEVQSFEENVATVTTPVTQTDSPPMTPDNIENTSSQNEVGNESSTIDSDDQIDTAADADNATDIVPTTTVDDGDSADPNVTDIDTSANTTDAIDATNTESSLLSVDDSKQEDSNLSQPASDNLSQTPPSAFSDDEKDTSSVTPTSSDDADKPSDNITERPLSNTAIPSPLDSTISSTSEPAEAKDSTPEQLPSSVPVVTSTATTRTTNVTQSTEAVTSTSSASPASTRRRARKKKRKKDDGFPILKKPLNPEKLFEGWKDRGNRYVKLQDYQAAIRCYSICASLSPSKALIYTNRALCHLKTNEPQQAEDDCTFALSIEPGNLKALYRRGLARKAMIRYGDAVKDLKVLLDLDPENAIARKEFIEVKQLWEKELRELQQSKKKGGSTSPAFGSSKASAQRPFSPLGTKPKDGRAPPSGIRDSRADRRRNSREARTAARSLRRIARQLPADAAGPLDKDMLQSLLKDISTKVGKDGSATKQSKRPSSDRLMTAGKTTYYDKEERNNNNGKSEDISDPFGLRGAKEAGEVNRATEKATRSEGSKTTSKKVKSGGGGKRKKITVTVQDASSDEDEASQKVGEASMVECVEATTIPESQVDDDDINSEVTMTNTVNSEVTETHSDSDVTITHADSNVSSDVTTTYADSNAKVEVAPVVDRTTSTCADTNAKMEEVAPVVDQTTVTRTDSNAKVEEVAPVVDQTTTTSQVNEQASQQNEISVSQDVAASTVQDSADASSDKMPDKMPDASSDKMPDTSSEPVKTKADLKATVKPATPYEFVQRWNSVSRSTQSTEYAKLLEEIPPSTLPLVITNKLDGIMLTSIIDAVDKHFIPKGLHQLGADILQNLTQVQRFGMVSMFLSSSEKKSLQNILSALSERREVTIEVDRLRTLYGVK